jgi:hypothetical protein
MVVRLLRVRWKKEMGRSGADALRAGTAKGTAYMRRSWSCASDGGARLVEVARKDCAGISAATGAMAYPAASDRTGPLLTPLAAQVASAWACVPPGWWSHPGEAVAVSPWAGAAMGISWRG